MKGSCCGVFFDREAKSSFVLTFRKNEGKEKGSY
jgi:hypothetical protein